jgi:hypothetical protein
MYTTTMLVTPADAREWLETKNFDNRPISQLTVARYAQEMRAGRWKLNGQSITFATSGRLLDGQHRLKACVQAGVSFETVVVKGADDGSFDTIDDGRKRTLADTLEKGGNKYSKNLAAGTRFVWEYGTGLISSKGGSRQAIATIPLLERMIDTHRGLRTSAKFYALLDSRAGGLLLPPSVAVGLHYLFSLVDHPKADEFFTDLQSGLGLKAGSPIAALRQRLINVARDAIARRVTREALFAYTVQAWNAFSDGRTLSRISWVPTMDLPTITELPQGLMKDLL